MRMVKRILALVVAVAIVFISIPKVYADETSDLILKLLIKKGIVSQKEVDELKAEIKKIEAEKPTPEAVAKHVEKTSWAERIKVKGDVRLRHEYEKPGSGTYTSYPRIRARAGIEAKLTDTADAGIWIASGSSDARSTNQSLTGAFSTKAINLDQAWISWKPINEVYLIGGKYKNPLYHPHDLIWDSDLRFEGASANIKYSLKNVGIPIDIMLNGGAFILDNLSIDKKNPYLYAAQAGLGSSVGDMFDWKAYIGYLDFAHIKGTRSTALVPTTGRADSNGFYYYDYNILELSGDITLHQFEQNLPKPLDVPVVLFADYVNNMDAGEKSYAWEAGVKVGNKPKKFADWLAVYNFRWLERNSFPDEFPDADIISGTTDGYSHEVIFSFGLTKNVWLEFDYMAYREKTMGVDPNDKWTHELQSDINVKF